MKKIHALALAAVLPFALTGCSSMNMGSSNAKTSATGATGGDTPQNANSKLERCSASLGTLAVVEDNNADWFRTLQNAKLGPTTPVLRLLVQQSNCFVIVERGRAMQNMQQERALASAGETRSGSNIGKGQMVAADFTMNPTVTFSNGDSGGIDSAIGGLLPGLGGRVVGAVAGNAKFKEASTMLMMIDNRSGVQLAAAEGSAKNVDFGAMGGAFGSALKVN